MSYIDRNLLEAERVLFRTKKHPIIFFYPIILTIFLIFAMSYMQENPILTRISWAPSIIIIIFWAYSFIEYFYSEFAVTNKRILMREGFFNRHSTELRLSAISQVTINQNLIGVWINSGTIIINAFGGYDAFTLIAKPIIFQRVVNEELDKLVK